MDLIDQIPYQVWERNAFNGRFELIAAFMFEDDAQRYAESPDRLLEREVRKLDE